MAASLSAPLASPALAKGSAAYHGRGVRYAEFRQRRTGEEFRGVYFENGDYLPDAMDAIDWTLRDDHVDKSTLMDPRLIDLMGDIRARLEGHDMIVTSGFRCQETNDSLRRRGAAKNSLHIHGMAVDFYSPQISAPRLARLVAGFEAGGVGRYDRRGFVHADVGEIRYWRG